MILHSAEAYRAAAERADKAGLRVYRIRGSEDLWIVESRSLPGECYMLQTVEGHVVHVTQPCEGCDRGHCCIHLGAVAERAGLLATFVPTDGLAYCAVCAVEYEPGDVCDCKYRPAPQRSLAEHSVLRTPARLGRSALFADDTCTMCRGAGRFDDVPCSCSPVGVSSGGTRL